MAGKPLAGTLAVLASIATILTFAFTVMNRPSTAPHPGRSTPASFPHPTGSSSPVTSANSVSPGYPSSAVNGFLSTCTQYTGLPVSHCRCDLQWVQTQAAYSASFVPNELLWVENAENNASCY